MGLEEELLRIAKKLEKMVARKKSQCVTPGPALRQYIPEKLKNAGVPEERFRSQEEQLRPEETKREGALDLLKKLSNCQMSIQLLQTTRIGVAVNGVRKHCSDKEVVSLAKVLIKNWKRLLDSPRTAKGEREEKDKAKKKEKGLGCSDWKPAAGLSPRGKKGGGDPKTRRDSVDSRSSAISSPKRPSMERTFGYECWQIPVTPSLSTIPKVKLSSVRTARTP